jgi:cell division protein FtsL
MEIFNNGTLLMVLLVSVLGIWSVALVWASWQIRLMIRNLAEERRELRRWARIKSVWERHGGKWS